MSEYLDSFLQGWEQGDVDMILSACADDFVMDDPAYGRFTKAEFQAYYDMQAEGGIEFSDVVSGESGGVTTQWGCWKQPSHEGGFLNKAGPDGVHSTWVTYYAPKPEIVPR